MCDGSGGFTVGGALALSYRRDRRGSRRPKDGSEKPRSVQMSCPLRGLVKEDETAEDPTKQKVKQELEEIETMFVQTAGEAVEGHVLTLDDVSRSTLYFSDWPERLVGHVRSEMLVELWDAGANSSRRERAQYGALVPGTRRQGPGGRRDGDPESSISGPSLSYDMRCSRARCRPTRRVA